MTHQTDDDAVSHDQLIKQLLQADLGGFVGLFYPHLAAQVDFSEIGWLDKEFFTDIPRGARRESDLVAQVTTRGAVPVSLLFLVELEDREGRRRKGVSLAERLFLYYSLLWARYRIPVYPIVLYLFRAKGGLRRHRHRHTLLGEVVNELRFRSIGLPRLSAREYLKNGAAIAGGLGALMDRTGWRPAEHKVACLDVIAASSAPESVKFLATNCVETYLELTGAEQVEYEALLAREEHMEARHLEKTWADRIQEAAFEKGVEQGLEQGALTGRRTTLLKLLRLKFGSLPEEVARRLDALTSSDQLDSLTERLLTANSLEELGLL